MIDGELYLAIYQVECTICAATPVVGLRTPGGYVASTGLCGAHFFGDRTQIDPEEWNRPVEDTE